MSLKPNSTLEELMAYAGRCPGGSCKLCTGTATVSEAGDTYVSTRAICPGCQTRVGVTTGPGYTRVVVTPAGSTERAAAAGRQKEQHIIGVPGDRDLIDAIDVASTQEAAIAAAEQEAAIAAAEHEAYRSTGRA